MKEDKSELKTLQIWLLAARPKTLPAAAAPVTVGTAMAFRDGSFQAGPALAALLAALLLQIGANLANDVFDYHRGSDVSGRLGPMRVTQAGLLKPEQVLTGMWITFGIATLLGLYLTVVAGWPVILIGLLSIGAAVAYTGGPFPFGYYGLGDLFVFLFFGVVAVCGTYFVQVRSITEVVIWSSFPMGFLITAILVVNNLRDIKTDQLTGKNTLAVRIGVSGTRIEYLTCLLAAYLIAVLMWLGDLVSGWILFVFLTLPMCISLIKAVWSHEGRILNTSLAGTGRLALFYALLFSLGIIFPIVLNFYL
jgi:1,4-dihydroxy-2-naphthoate octaprenyltransferase